ncbi:TetR/AcrR family transcriptional regulator [Mycolicibacterium sp. HK-90]|uniref:TetR/AcrR family transcriptional regulator n=1 Tax=Mycolicibacterium sp. HK-90 TaxID=3056937 RepID=UPI0026595FCF|nr:TetR/AcrR family transcriptional regulator [Mycolicibacterium sp. HK-90]WKG06290.1 TetR/AcrR family transcriptional regulator [Mycolicibacterium sp. HK-90]
MTPRGRPRGGGRGPGRPVGADAAQTRERIVRAAYEVINEHGYAATTFQEVAKRSGLSRPTLNYYFATREDLYGALLKQAHDVVTRCIDVAKQHEGTLDQLRAYIDAVVAVWDRDRAVVGFLVNARLEACRHPGLPAATVAATRGFLDEVVTEAIARRELPPHTEPAALAELLHAMLWGIGAYTGWQRRAVDLPGIAKQLHKVIGSGLLPDAECEV